MDMLQYIACVVQYVLFMLWPRTSDVVSNGSEIAGVIFFPPNIVIGFFASKEYPETCAHSMFLRFGVNMWDLYLQY